MLSMAIVGALSLCDLLVELLAVHWAVNEPQKI